MEWVLSVYSLAAWMRAILEASWSSPRPGEYAAAKTMDQLAESRLALEDIILTEDEDYETNSVWILITHALVPWRIRRGGNQQEKAH